jgi:membrane protein DedA with SNARE-associated domain
MLDIGGYLTSTEFVTQVAAFIATLLSIIVGQVISFFLGVSP